MSSKLKNPFSGRGGVNKAERETVIDLTSTSNDHPNNESNPFESEQVPLHPSSSSSSQSSAVSVDELAQREAAIRAREERLRKRELDLEAKAREIGAALKPKNWPSRCYPLYYHDISEEIPEEKQQFVKKFYHTCLITFFALILNFLTVIVTVGGCSGTSFSAFVWAALYCVAGFPGSFRGWYWIIYQMNKKNKAGLRWVAFFIIFGLHLIFFILLTVGYNSGGGGGVLTMLDNFSKGCKAAAMFALLDTAVCGLLAFYSFYLLKIAYSAWRKSGGSVNQLKGDMAAAAVSQSLASA